VTVNLHYQAGTAFYDGRTAFLITTQPVRNGVLRGEFITDECVRFHLYAEKQTMCDRRSPGFAADRNL